MRILLATALLFPIALLANPTHIVKVHFTNNTDAHMHYETLTIGQDTRIVDYPRQLLNGHAFPEEALVLMSQSDHHTNTTMTYEFMLPADMCEAKKSSCTETVLLNWQTNMGSRGGDNSICGVSGKNFEPLEKLRAYCTIPLIDPRDPETLHIHYFFEYAQ